jgi:hypothetical protein
MKKTASAYETGATLTRLPAERERVHGADTGWRRPSHELRDLGPMSTNLALVISKHTGKPHSATISWDYDNKTSM